MHADQNTVLVADDDPVTRARLQHLLERNGYDVVSVEDGAAAWALAENRHFPFVITDWAMPHTDGPALCAKLREKASTFHSYVIILTGHADKGAVARGLEAGADDYLTKPFDSGELLARLRVGRRFVEMQRRTVETERQLRALAIQDGLTGVLNRRALDERLQGAYAYFLRGGPPMSVAILDVDYFKAVNDNYGHQAGDAVLQELAQRIRVNLRAYDTVGRYGGEEFLVVYPDTDVTHGRLAAERMRGIISATPMIYGDLSLPITVSVGVCTVETPYRGPLSRIVECADEALYLAKKMGRNRCITSQLPERVPALASIATGDMTTTLLPGYQLGLTNTMR